MLEGRRRRTMSEGCPRRMSSQARASGDRTCELGIMCTQRVVCNNFGFRTYLVV
jgi:hypothetical protein